MTQTLVEISPLKDRDSAYAIDRLAEIVQGGYYAPPGVTIPFPPPVSGGIIVMGGTQRYLYIDSGPLTQLTIRLPVVQNGESVEISFANLVTTLVITDAASAPIVGSPINAFGPGAAIIMRRVNAIWVYWK